MTRRDLLMKAPVAGAAAGAGLLAGRTAWAQSHEDHGPANLRGIQTLTGSVYDLVVDHASVRVRGRDTHAIAVNGQVPAPLLRWREGQDVELRVTNRLREDTSIHWHGILLPFQMDGVPGVTFPGIKPGETFTYRFPLKQSGTYWYHSHSNLQEQMGHYGPIVIDPAGADPVAADREYVVVLSDWSFMHPHRIFGRLKKSSDSFNFQKRTVGNFFSDIDKKGWRPALSERLMWGKMRMSPADIADVTSAAYTYLINGHSAADNWTALFEPGQKIRLRLINASAMTIFDVRLPGLPMTVVQADGQNVQPVEVGELQIGVAETYDIVVQPPAAEAYTLMCESIERSGYVRATLAPKLGMSGPIAARRPRPTLTMKDMGMAHDMDHSTMDHSKMDHSKMDHSKMDHSQMGHEGAHAMQEHRHKMGPGVQSVAMMPTNRLSEPGTGLDDEPHLVLSYTDLVSLEPNPDQRPPGRELEVHLTGNMERFIWSLDGKKFSDDVEPIRFKKDERLRLTFVNDTMMNHPMHLHGMFFEVVNGQESNKPRKHTILVKPGDKISVDVTADAVGDWAFHCHMIYHMHAGMFQIVSVR